MRTATTRLSLIVLAGLLSQSAFAEPPPGFLRTCKKETRLYQRELARYGGRKGSFVAKELQAVRNGKLVPPKLTKFVPGTIEGGRLS